MMIWEPHPNCMPDPLVPSFSLNIFLAVLAALALTNLTDMSHWSQITAKSMLDSIGHIS